MSNNIICPNCHHEFSLSDIQKHEMEEMRKQAEETLAKERAKFEKEKENEREEMRKKAQEFAQKKAEEASEKAKKEFELVQKDLELQLKKSEEEKLEAKRKELDFLKREKEMKEKEENFVIEMEKEKLKIEENLKEKMKNDSQKLLDEKMIALQEEFRKKELEYQKQQEQLKKSLDDAKRKAEQWSQQIQGDISENDLRDALINAFPFDDIADVPTGVKGADLIQTVRNNFGQNVWTIVWESKNTKSWQDDWIMKLKDDTLKIGGNISIIVTNVLPKEIKNFGLYDGVMVCSQEFAISVCAILRDKILSISKVEKSLEWKDLKMELLYKYLTSQEFSSKISMMIQVFANLKSGIDKERRAMETNWKRREKDLERATFAITGLYGELESLMWQALPGAEVLELESGDEDEIDE